MNIIGLHGALATTADSNWSNPVWSNPIMVEAYPVTRELPDTDKSLDMDSIHDAGCTLFVDGKHIRSVDEERLTRKK